MNELIRNGRLAIPLYHGTSSLFYESILAHGLGGKNLISDLGIRDAARHLIELSPEMNHVPQWPLEMFFCKKLAVDSLPHDFGLNFRYGGVYLTPSPRSAVNYSSAFGSEALESILRALKLVDETRPELGSSSTFCKIRAISERPGSPLLVEVRDVEVSLLRSEQGGASDNVLRSINEALEDPELFDIMAQQSNLEHLQPIPPNQLRFFHVHKSDESSPIAAFHLAAFGASSPATDVRIC